MILTLFQYKEKKPLSYDILQCIKLAEEFALAGNEDERIFVSDERPEAD